MISKILKACQFLLVRKMILLFAYQEISAIFTGPILFFVASYGLSTSVFHIDYYTLHQVHLIMFVENHSKIV